MTAQISQIRTVADGIAKFRPTEQAGTRARALEDVVTVSDESPFTAAFLARVAGCSTMISEHALGADREAPPSR